MTRSRSALAEAIEALAADQDVALTETRDGLVLNQLHGADVRRLLDLLVADGWADISVSDEGGRMDPGAISDEDFGITVKAQKPGIPEGVEALLTRAGLASALVRHNLACCVWIHGLNAAFETHSTRFAPWGDTTAFTPRDVAASPRKVVRVLDDGTRFPNDLSRWMLRKPEAEINGWGIEPWRKMSVERLAQAIANEVEPEGQLLFRGPPVTRFAPDTGPMVEASGLENIQEAAQWVYENARETENRHGLLAAEIARTALTGGTANDLAASTGKALESAKIAYNFGVTQQSKDTLKALADLRKAIGDETAKLAENTRGLATAVTASVVANLGIIVARLTAPATSEWVPAAAISIGLVLAVYVGTIIASGVHFLRLQRTLRSEWRDRLYRFLDQGEYDRMVTNPVASAERGFWIACFASGAMAFGLLVSVCLIAGRV
ncbi:hypothetical protein C1T17_13845 [Sphingobium sp. SCG-1]|uniref:hypothetical protein n=1 Tax=Sphingobium sp. SCG-1 TaxID=2072936 RepID=UPI000CD686A7|nr:hypothetical protein [Sphingobium sp. SCG-1]AUW59016.1 hypothetical protein C1T17_13845 [Sphingobium sp. SCG-1]